MDFICGKCGKQNSSPRCVRCQKDILVATGGIGGYGAVEVINVQPNFKDPHIKNTGGTKHDSGKPPLSIIPRCALEAEAEAFAHGARKYGRGNYKNGFDWSRLIDATMRHVVAFNAGENLDAESGLSHLAHARASLAMLLWHVENKAGKDDR